MDTSVASSMRRCAAEAWCRQQQPEISVKLTWPINSDASIPPRTRIVCSFEALMPSCGAFAGRSSAGRLLASGGAHSRVSLFESISYFDMLNRWNRIRQVPGPFVSSFRISNKLDSCATQSRAASPRSHGVFQGTRRHRAFTRENAAADAQRKSRAASRCLQPLPAGAFLTWKSWGTSCAADALSASTQVLELGAAYLESMNIEQLTKRTWKSSLATLAIRPRCACWTPPTSCTWRAPRCGRLIRLARTVGSRFPAHATSPDACCGRPERRWLETYFKTAKLEALTIEPWSIREDCAS